MWWQGSHGERVLAPRPRPRAQQIKAGTRTTACVRTYVCSRAPAGGCQRPWGLAFQEHQAAQAARARRGGGTGPVVRGK